MVAYWKKHRLPKYGMHSPPWPGPPPTLTIWLLLILVPSHLAPLCHFIAFTVLIILNYSCVLLNDRDTFWECSARWFYHRPDIMEWTYTNIDGTGSSLMDLHKRKWYRSILDRLRHRWYRSVLGGLTQNRWYRSIHDVAFWCFQDIRDPDKHEVAVDVTWNTVLR